jgi:hypothetical protein
MNSSLVLKGSHGSGLGDLIRCLLVAIAYAKLSKRRLYVDWRGGLYKHPPERNLFDDLFHPVDLDLALGPPDSGSVHPARWAGALDKTFASVYEEDGEPPWNRQAAIEKYSFDLGWMNYPHDVLVMWDFDQFGKLRPALEQKLGIPMNLTHGEAMGLLFRRHLRLSSHLEERLDQAWSRIPQGQSLIGVHVRLTRESTQARGAISLRNYYRAIGKLAKNGAAGVFLATDNEAVQQQFERRYRGRVFANPKWFDAAGQPLHLANERCPDSWENIIGAMLDMFLLARCNALVYPEWSSFSTVSRFVGEFAPAQVIALNYRGSLLRRVKNRIKRFMGGPG